MFLWKCFYRFLDDLFRAYSPTLWRIIPIIYLALSLPCLYSVCGAVQYMALRGRDSPWHRTGAICTNWAMTNCSLPGLKNCSIIIAAVISYVVHMCLCTCVFLCSASCVTWWMCCTISGTLVVCSLSDSKPSWLHGHETLFSNVRLSSPCQSTGLASTSSQVPNWKAVLHHSTCATTCWSSPEASLPSSLATGSCRRYDATVLCQMASCSREGLGVDTVSI